MTAIISPCGKYRYLLERKISTAPKTALFIMLNPSTADATLDDRTIKKCRGFAERINDVGLLQVINLFSYRSTDPWQLPHVEDPYGIENEKYQNDAIQRADIIICAWGAMNLSYAAANKMQEKLSKFPDKVFALDITKNGHPKHPLYIPYNITLKRYK